MAKARKTDEPTTGEKAPDSTPNASGADAASDAPKEVAAWKPRPRKLCDGLVAFIVSDTLKRSRVVLAKSEADATACFDLRPLGTMPAKMVQKLKQPPRQGEIVLVQVEVPGGVAADAKAAGKSPPLLWCEVRQFDSTMIEEDNR